MVLIFKWCKLPMTFKELKILLRIYILILQLGKGEVKCYQKRRRIE